MLQQLHRRALTPVVLAGGTRGLCPAPVQPTTLGPLACAFLPPPMRSPRGHLTTEGLGSQGVLGTYSVPAQPLEVGFPSQDFGSWISGSWGEAVPHWGASDRDLAPGLGVEHGPLWTPPA